MSPSVRPASEIADVPSNERRVRQKLEDDASAENSYVLAYPSRSTSVPSVPFQQPSPLLTFSYTPARELEFTDSAMKYYSDPPSRAQLGYGYERWTRRPEEKGRLDGLLKAISKVKANMESANSDGTAWLRDIGVVSWRGVMTKILTAPYEDRDGWQMNVMIVNDTLYFEEHISDAKLVEKESMTPRQRLQTYYGYSFESWCTSSSAARRETLPGHPPGWSGDVDTNVQWCSVVKTKLGDNRLVIGGEVDCVRGTFRGKTDAFVELKTSMNIRNAQDEARFEKKLLKFYLQSFLLGVPEIIVGFRTPSGQLTTTQSFKTIEIPRLVRGKPGAWDPSICLDWAHRFLSFLKSTIRHSDVETSLASDSQSTEERPGCHVWRVTFTPGSGIAAIRLDDEGVKEVEAGEDRVGFLPRWYWDEIRTSATPGSVGPTEKRSKTQEGHHLPSGPSESSGASKPAGLQLPAGWQI